MIQHCWRRPATRGRRRLVAVSATGAEAAAATANVRSPETYVGYERAENFVLAGRRRRGRAACLCARRRRASTNGALSATGRSATSTRRLERTGRQHRLPLPRARPASRARAGAGRQAGALPRDRSTASRPATATASTSTPTAKAWSRSSGSTSSSARTGRSAIAPSRSSSSIPASRPTPSPSARSERSHDAIRRPLTVPVAALTRDGVSWQLLLVAAVGTSRISELAAEEARVIPPPALDEPASRSRAEVAVLAGGCFWGVQGVFQHVKGVTNAVSGYAGGDKQTARYEMVGSGTTGHAESVQVTFDPRKISYGRLLQIFSRSRTIRPSSIGRAPTSARSTARRSSRRTPEQAQDRQGLHRAARTRRASSTRRSSPRSSRTERSIRPRTITRTS